MAFTFNSIGHFFAKAYKAAVSELPKVEGTKLVVEGVSAVAAPQLVPIEDAAYAVLGELSSVLTSGGEAATQKLANAGLDISVINKVKAVIASVPEIVALAKKL